MSLRGLDLFLKYYFSNAPEKLATLSTKDSTNDNATSSASSTSPVYNIEKVEQIFNDQKFWRFSRDNSLKIRGEFFELINSILDNLIVNKSLMQLSKQDVSLLAFRKNLKAKIVPLVFYSCDEDSQTCSYFVWKSILKSLTYFNSESDYREGDADFWSLLNVKKAFIPKLIALLKNHANGNANSQNVEIIYDSLAALLSNLSGVFDNDNNEKLNFYKEFFLKLSDAIFKETNFKNRSNFLNNKARMVYSMFDCMGLALNDLLKEENIPSENVDFCSYAISNYVRL